MDAEQLESAGSCPDGRLHHRFEYWLDPPVRAENTEAAGSSGAYSVRKIRGNPEGAWLLLRESFLYQRQSRCKDKAQPERRCEACAGCQSGRACRNGIF